MDRQAASPNVARARIARMSRAGGAGLEAEEYMPLPPQFQHSPSPKPTKPQGEWAFASLESADAAQRFANTPGFGTDGLLQPSADQIWKIRQMYKKTIESGYLGIEKDPTTDIGLIWKANTRPKLKPQTRHKPAAPLRDAELKHKKKRVLPSELRRHKPLQCRSGLELALAAEPTPAKSLLTPYTADNPEPDLGWGIDSNSHLAHDPLNSNTNDQRSLFPSSTRPNYHTALFHNPSSNATVKITLDRTPARKNHPEPHKFWHYDGNRWIRWLQASTHDWESDAAIEKLNKYRDQSARRGGWKNKREAPRFKYTNEQVEWMWRRVAAAAGRMPDEGPEVLAEEFNEAWELVGTGQERQKGGMRSLVEKLGKEWRENGGVRKAGKKGGGGRKGKGVKRKDGSEKTVNGVLTPALCSAQEKDAAAALMGLAQGGDYRDVHMED